MRTKLSVYCDRVLEAGWLMALVVAPLFFNIYSDRVFEPDKIALIRSIAVIMCVAWVTRQVDGMLSARQTRGEEGAGEAQESLWRRILSTPLVLPTLLMVLAYLLSTALSMVPRLSLWGSYQRLQGAYSFLSYMVIFFMLLSTLRRREQLIRLINLVVITSLPIAIYGILQRFGRDPLPWGGDVMTRVASNMGNAIFIAAYMIMAVFLTIERLIYSFTLLLDEKRGSLSHAFLTGSYLAVLVAQLVCIFFSQSRGPWLGLLAGLYVFVLLGLVLLRRRQPDQSALHGSEIARAAGLAVLSLPAAGVPVYGVMTILKRGLRWMWLSWIIQAVFGVAFLIVFNLPGSPLEPIREAPYIGRLGQILETETGTGRVRVLIWEGVLDLLARNPARTIVGYGPESMHVAYNQAYPPELGHYEARNASPDRSHNETFDALVTTGVIGFSAYIFLFGSIFYFGLRWLGLIRRRQDDPLFVGLAVAGAVAGVLLPLLMDGSLTLAGVGLPAGFIFGVIVYITISAAKGGEARVGDDAPRSLSDQLLLIALLATVLAHFVEIHFGIAIASTRTYFWALTGVFVILGLRRVSLETMDTPEAPAVIAAEPLKGKKRKPAKTVPVPRGSEPLVTAVAFSVLMGLVFSIAGYDYITNQAGEQSTLGIIWRSLTSMGRAPGPFETSWGMLGLFLVTWIVGGILTVAGTMAIHEERGRRNDWMPFGLAYVGVSTSTALPFVLWHAGRLLPNVAEPANHIVVPLVAVIVGMFLLAAVLYRETRLTFPHKASFQSSWLAASVGSALLMGAFVFVWVSNVQVVQADVYYKQGKTADGMGRWDASIALYEKAISLAPMQDFYYLFLGRSQLEKVGTLADAAQREAQVERSLATLIKARELNPLNTDHTANLGRLHRVWAQNTQDAALRQERFQASLRYYEEATALSPNNAGLLNEWGQVLHFMGEHDAAIRTYHDSLELDQEFDQTYLMLGDTHLTKQDFDQAADYYRQALAVKAGTVQAHSALGYIYAQTGRLGEAIEQNLLVLEYAPQDYVSMRNLTLLLEQVGDLDAALQYGEMALTLAPEQDQAPLQQFLDRIRQKMEE